MDDGGGKPSGGVSSASNAAANGTTGNANGRNTGVRGSTFDGRVAAQSAAPDSRAGSSMTGMAAMVSMDEAAEAAKANFGFASQVDTKMGTQNIGYGALSDTAYGRATSPSLSSEAITAAQNVAGLPEAIAMAARPGLISRGLTTMASLANPALGAIATAYGAQSAAKNAQASIGAINDAFGTTMDDSYGTAIGQQALGTTSGLLGGKVGGKFGANLGRSVGGVSGAIAGGLLGALGVSSAARDAAMDPAGSNNGPQGPAVGGDGMSNANRSTGQAVAST